MNIDKLKEFRRYIHAHPELSNEEVETAKRVVDYLNACNPDTIIHPIGGTGVLAVFDSGVEGPTVLVRCELDALPIEEINTFEHTSTRKAVSHMCGHDGHLTMLLGVADHLKNNKPQSGKVYLLFQPGEENGTGAKAVMEELSDHGLTHIDYCIALHNLPGYPLGEIVLKRKAFTAHVISLDIRLKGKTSHAAEPELGLNPAPLIADVLQECKKLTNNNPENKDFFLITPIFIEMGQKSYGISAGQGELDLTIRAWDTQLLKSQCERLETFIKSHAQHYGLETELVYSHEFYSNQNNDEVVDLLQSVAENNEYPISIREYPFKWGEDFGLFTQEYPGAMFGIGSGEECPALHNPDYDFPDDLLPVGITMFTGFIDKLLNKNV